MIRSFFMVLSLLSLPVACAKKENQPPSFTQAEYCALSASHLAKEVDQAEVLIDHSNSNHKIATYLSENKLQEAIWIAEKSPSQRNEVSQLKERLHTLLVSGSFTVLPNVIDGVNNRKQLVEFENGIQALFKPNITASDSEFHFTVDYHAEIAAYRIDQLLELGIVPMTVERTIHGEPGSLQYFVHQVSDGSRHNFKASGFVKMKVFDYIIENQDRKLVNFLFWPAENRIIAIDHGIAFKNFQCGDEPEISRILKLDNVLHTKLSSLSDPEIRTELSHYLQASSLESTILKIHSLLHRAATHSP